jgi:hypothetical protein
MKLEAVICRLAISAFAYRIGSLMTPREVYEPRMAYASLATLKKAKTPRDGLEPCEAEPCEAKSSAENAVHRPMPKAAIPEHLLGIVWLEHR